MALQETRVEESGWTLEQESYWREEIARRIARIDSGEEKMMPMEAFFTEIDAMLEEYDDAAV